MASSPPARLAREAVERIYPLRPVQQGMLFHELAAADLSPYFRQVSFAIEGAVDPSLCEATWHRLMARHAMLRSLFDYERAAQPLQILLKTQTIEFGFEDVEGPEAAARIDRWRQADMRRGFDLRQDRLMRVRLFRLGQDRFEMVWSHPHILLDGWSGSILLEEFALLYAAARKGGALELPPPPDPGGYLAALAARDHAAAKDYWAALLAGYQELATLPRLAGDRGPQRPTEHRFSIGERETAALAALAARHGATLGILLQALWGLVLGRWTDRQDVVFGVVVSGRSVATENVDRLVGMFINTVPVRVQWDGRQTFGDLLQMLQQQALDGVAHDHVALAEVQAATELPDGLLDHLIVLENYPAADADSAGTGFTVTRAEAVEQANYDFGLLVNAGATLDVNLPHDAGAFPPGQMARIERHIRTLVARILASPDAPLSALDPMPDDERRELAAWANGPAVPRGDAASIADLWHAQVDRAPDRLALVAGAERLSYRALDEMAEGVAAKLRGEGLAAGDPVAVLAGRTAGRVAALLGILKAGGVYLPLSPALPDERIRFMLDDANCRRVLVDAMGASRLEGSPPGLAQPIATAPPPRRGAAAPAAGDLAYIIYTSGSTGKPKGVAVEHRGFANMILAQIAGFGVRPDDAVVQFASCSFDASLSETFMALLAGARLVVAPEQAIRDGAALLLMAAEGVTIATLPPSYLRALDGPSLGGLRVLITAGEPPDLRDARRYARSLHYFNAYGPTEASVCASWHKVDPDAPYPGGVPVGRPIANTAMMVLDRAGRPMPVGAVGEICLAGPGLARGYLGLPALTDERFQRTGAGRVYRTGDSGLVQTDGEIVYCGRRDAQVKLNGYRIELGEIESRLRDHPSVAQAAAVVGGNPGRLVAYAVPSAPVEPAELREALAVNLPAWMVPAEIVLLEALPRTVAGKVDRRALAAGHAPQAVSAAAPPTPAEALVAEAFAAVLGRGPFGRGSSFAAAGGDSLRAIQLLGRLRRGGLILDLKDMLAADTVAAIAAIGRQHADEDHRLAAGAVPLTPVQRWFFESHSSGVAQFNHLVLLCAVAGPLDQRALAAALDALWRHHDALRLTYQRAADGWTQAYAAPAGPFQLRTVDLRHLGDPWPALAADAEAAQLGFDLGHGPLFKATLYRLGGGDHLLLNAHHLVVDAVSWRIIVEDLGAALRQAAAGQAIRLPGKTSAYRDWAIALGDWARSAAEAERLYWAAVSAAEIAPLPTDFKRVPHGYADTETVKADLGPVRPDVPDRQVVARLLAALGAALHAWDGRRAARVTLSSHGRHPPVPKIDVSRTVGWFTADFPFLFECPGTAGAIEAGLVAVPSKGLGWGALRWFSDAPATLPEPELSLNFLGSIDELPGPDFALSEGLPSVSVGAMERVRLIEVEAVVVSGRLELALRYAARIHAPATARSLLDAMAAGFAQSGSHATELSG